MQEAIKQARIKLKESGEKEEGTQDDDSVQPGAGPGSAPRGGGAGGLPDLSALAGMLGGGAGGAGGGGMPDLASLMQNPALMQM
jgi:small glutamine-rich tetratricopeptide repeat-containing protein alpha